METETETAFDRLKKVWDIAFTRIEPGQPVPPMPPQFGEWAQQTTTAMFVGILFQGGKQFLDNRRLGPYVPQEKGLSKAQVARQIAEENTRRLSRTCRQAIKGGLAFGGLAGLFFAIELTATIAAGEKTVNGKVAAAGITGAVGGAFLAPTPAMRLRSSAIAAVVAGAVGYPVGVLHQQVEAKMGISPEKAADITPRDNQKRYPALEGDPTQSVIERMEATLR